MTPGAGLQTSPNLALDFHSQGGKGSSQSKGHLQPLLPTAHSQAPEICAQLLGEQGVHGRATPGVRQTKHGRGRGSSNEGKGKLVPSWEIPERHGSFQRARIPKMRKRGESLMVALHQQQPPPCPTPRQTPRKGHADEGQGRTAEGRSELSGSRPGAPRSLSWPNSRPRKRKVCDPRELQVACLSEPRSRVKQESGSRAPPPRRRALCQEPSGPPSP